MAQALVRCPRNGKKLMTSSIIILIFTVPFCDSRHSADTCWSRTGCVCGCVCQEAPLMGCIHKDPLPLVVSPFLICNSYPYRYHFCSYILILVIVALDATFPRSILCHVDKE